MNDTGERLIKIFMLCKKHNIDISIMPSILGSDVFSIKLRRGTYQMRYLIDCTHNYLDPVCEVERVFYKALNELDDIERGYK